MTAGEQKSEVEPSASTVLHRSLDLRLGPSQVGEFISLSKVLHPVP